MADALPDIIAGQLAVVFCGINPGMTAAAAGHHFAGRGNRFWRVIHLAGFTPGEILPENDHTILRYGCGLTTVVERPTARADQLSVQEFIAVAGHFEHKIARYAPRFVAFLGKAAYSALSGRREIAWGYHTNARKFRPVADNRQRWERPVFHALPPVRTYWLWYQSTTLGGAAVWVLPNPSGRNRAFSLDQLVSAYRQLYQAADQSRLPT